MPLSSVFAFESKATTLFKSDADASPGEEEESSSASAALRERRRRRATTTAAAAASSSSSSSSSPSDGGGEVPPPPPAFDYDSPLPDSRYTQALSTTTTNTGGLSVASRLRDHYDAVFGDPREPDGRRFSFDPWHVKAGEGKDGEDAPGLPPSDDEDGGHHDVAEGERDAASAQVQYSLTRAQCSDFFPEELFDDLADEMTALGRTIGLTATTNPWISMYMDGDLQNFHTDAPHGPMAWVLGLTRDADFKGGETVLLRPEMLDYWRDFDGSRGLESPSILRYVPSYELGRCLAFDGRVPHGVNRVDGARDVRNCRVVAHGWFADPQVCWFGPWGGGMTTTTEEEGEDGPIGGEEGALDDTLRPLVEALGDGEIGRVTGYLAVRIVISPCGEVSDVRSVCDTLMADPEDFRGVIGYDESDRPVMEDACADVRLTIFEALKGAAFSEGDEGRSAVVPFAFS
mmetsp:Transcript_1309/g.3575  ORF Transcript_1309/g.3575 Transcript_1309/m.3575 type:complete len:459 (-) Transcript_1309:462-1838(-)